jgi:hypothetical protein
MSGPSQTQDISEMSRKHLRGEIMFRRIGWACLLAVVCIGMTTSTAQAEPQAYGRTWGGAYGNNDWERFYHYPYVYYPQNFWGNEYYRSKDSLYYRYPQEMRIPVYNKKWYNYYPNARPYYSGHHFVLDVF